MPPELAEEYEPLALLKEASERQTLLLRERATGAKLVLKRMLRLTEGAEEKYALLSRLAGDGIPKIRRFFQSGNAVYLLREYVEGETLLDLLQKRGCFSEKETAQVGIALCRTLYKLHSQKPPLVHRDIKAENIIRTPAGEYMLIDFDIARFYNQMDSRDTELLGSAFAAPPEQFGYRQTDPRSDIYAVGVLLHELSTGECLLEKGKTPAALRSVVSRCTRFDPKDRYQSAAALEQALKRVAVGRRRSAAVPILIAFLAVCAVLGFAEWRRRSGVQPDGIYEFHSAAIEREVCRQLQKEPGTVTRDDLARITHLFLCGDQPFDNWWQMDIHGAELQIDGLLGGTGGTVDTLEDIRYFPALQELALCNQQIKDLSPLAGSNLQRLALHGNRIEDLSPLTECERLLDLFISNNPVSDLSPLTGCRELCTLNVGATALTDLDSVAAIPKLRFFSIHDCPGVTDITPIGSMEDLVCLSIRPVKSEDLEIIGGMKELEQLYVWCGEATEDLTELSNLTGLTHLFVDIPLTSLEGVESLTKLEYLDVRSATPLDPTPLRGLTMLEELNAVCLEDGTLRCLAELPTLEHVNCTAGQERELRQALAERPDVEISVF